MCSLTPLLVLDLVSEILYIFRAMLLRFSVQRSETKVLQLEEPAS